MFLTYHRAGRAAVLPAVAGAGVLLIVGGTVAAVAVTAVAVVSVARIATAVLRALGLGRSKRPRAGDGEDTVEGVVVTRWSLESGPNRTQELEPRYGREDPRSGSVASRRYR